MQNGVCGEDLSSVAKIEVSPATDAGALTAAATVCYGDNSGELALSGHVGAILRWEYTTTGEAPWTPILHTESTLTYAQLLETTWYRVIVKSGVCEEKISNEVKIQVDELTVAGELSGPSAICAELNDGSIRLTGQRGTILRWQHSADGSSWTDIANQSDAQEFEDLTATTLYRAEVQNGVCAAAFSDPFTLKVNELPVVIFTSSEECEGIGTSFSNTSYVPGGSVSSQRWDFGDASSSVASDPVHRYNEFGSFPAKLVVISQAGCIDSLSRAVMVNPNPRAQFSQTNVCVGFPMDFSSLSTVALGNIADYSWELGDGGTAVQDDFQHTYATDGEFEVRLRVVSDKGCADETTRQVTVYPEPVTRFESSDVCFGEPSVFQNNSSISSGNLTYVWDFGDGSQSTGINPRHSYSAFGTYVANLQATTLYGCTREYSQTITIHEQPLASFSFEDVCLDAPARFTDTSTGDELSYSWKFGDGADSQERSPAHSYTSPAFYQVSLEVENAGGCRSSATEVIKEYPMPVINFSMRDVCQDTGVAFQNNSSLASGTLQYLWAFGDGQQSTSFAPSHAYDTDGRFEVSLTGTSDFGCRTTLKKEVEIFAMPLTVWSAEPVCDGFPTAFQNTSSINSGAIASFLWDFGDQTNSIVPNPTKQYLNPGSYVVSLLAESDKGCKTASTAEVVVWDSPIANFTVENVCFEYETAPKNLSEIASGTLSYSWAFGDGSGSAAYEPAHIYEQPGDYEITLTASSEHNCRDVFSRQVRVYEVPDADAGQDTTVSQGYPVQLLASGGLSYSWFPVDGLSNSNIASPVATPLVTTEYEVLVTDQYGCQGSDTVRVSVREDFKIVASNVFTPDENGQNDTWVISNLDTFGDVNVRVYDRYGGLIFQETAYQNDWRGTYGNDILPDGTYFYVITFSASERKYQGALTIIRNR